MYDASFDHPASRLGVADRAILWALRIAAVLAMSAVAADAQMISAPVFQNAWATPGFVAGINATGGGGGSVIGGAAAWAPRSGRVQLSGGAGYENRSGGGSTVAYGVRLAVPIGSPQSEVGFAPFVGIGGGGGGTTDGGIAVVGPISFFLPDTVASTTKIPFGVGFGWRKATQGSNGNGFSIYATPSYTFFSGGTESDGLFRTAIAADVGLSRSFGATVGVEFGMSRSSALGGPDGVMYGIGVSYAFGRR
ncbi:MAG TPA: hypothetical protein VIP11_07515 [Gemmatimonadaceae bacterium]